MRLLGYVVLAAALLAAGGVHAQSLEKKKITIAVGGKSLLYYLPLTIAERKGYFKNEGLDVEMITRAARKATIFSMLGRSVSPTFSFAAASGG